MKTMYLLFLILCLGGHTLAQTTRYVAPTGSNTGNDCTQPGNPCETIVHALNEANTNDIIELAPGEYTQSQSGGLLISKSITIQGTDRETTFIQAHTQPQQAAHRTITIAPLAIDVVINNVTIRNGVASGAGIPGRAGGLYYDFDPNNPSTLEIDQVRFSNNTARVGGGMFVVSNTVPTLTTTVFNDNSATERGGAMYLYIDSEPIISNVVFNGNIAGITGGAIYANASNPVFTNCNFSSNFASLGCGAITYQSGSGGTFTGGGFYNHQVSGNGGAVCIDGGSNPDFSTVQFDNNEALGGNGGAVHIVNNSNPTFTQADFKDNQATDETGGGGAVYVNTNSSPEFINTHFTNNSAFGDGGAILSLESIMILENVRFEQNSAQFYGGAIAQFGASANYFIQNGWFIENSTDIGGAIYTEEGYASIFNAVFKGNTATMGGAILNYQLSTPNYYNLTFYGNTAQSGGALYNSGSSTHFIYNSIFWGNSANEGNEIYNNATSVATLHYSLIINDSENVVEGNGFTCNQCIDGDPLFADPANNNFLISENSPAIDAGDPNTISMGFPHINGNSIDIVFNPRFVEVIDIGAYEWNENLSIESVENPISVMVYPNPTPGLININSEKNIVEIQLYTALGQRLSVGSKQTTSNKASFDLSEFPTGLYFLLIQTSEGKAGFQIIKK